MGTDERAQRCAVAEYLKELAEHIREGRFAAISIEWASGQEVAVKVVPLAPASFVYFAEAD